MTYGLPRYNEKHLITYIKPLFIIPSHCKLMNKLYLYAIVLV